MSLDNPLFLTVLFGIFHILGGLAFGRGIRAKMKAEKTGGHLLVWGAIMGITPILFDWFFLIRVGKITYGLIGPVLFFATVIGGIFLNGELTRNNEKSISAMLMGGASLLLGFMLTPYLLQQAQTRENLEFADYLCGGLIPIFFIGVGLSFVWNGFSAIRKRRTFDEHIAEREQEIEEKSERRNKQRG
ncbi:MAG: WVD2 family protein [Anaerolineales bacterium]|nr:WVD2 family protein [Anaerolineales bacterium]